MSTAPTFAHVSTVRAPHVLRVPPAPLSQALAHGRFDDAVRRLLRETEISTAAIIYLPGFDKELYRTQVIDFDEHRSRGRAMLAAIERLMAATDSVPEAEDLHNLPDEVAAGADAAGERMIFTVATPGIGTLLFLLLARPGSTDWREGVRQRLVIAGPALLQLADAEATMRRATRRLTLLEGTLDEMSLAVFMLDAQARPFCVNAAAFSRLAMADALRLSRTGILSCTNQRDTLALHRAVRNLLQAPVDEWQEQSIVISTTDGGRVIGSLRPVGAPDAEQDNRAVILMVKHEVSLSRAAFYALGLTRTEQRFLSIFLCCTDVVVAANRLGLSDETARTYLKRICAKLGVRKQVELAAFIWNLLPPLRGRNTDPDQRRAPGALGRLNHLREA